MEHVREHLHACRADAGSDLASIPAGRRFGEAVPALDDGNRRSLRAYRRGSTGNDRLFGTCGRSDRFSAICRMAVQAVTYTQAKATSKNGDEERSIVAKAVRHQKPELSRVLLLAALTDLLLQLRQQIARVADLGLLPIRFLWDLAFDR